MKVTLLVNFTGRKQVTGATDRERGFFSVRLPVSESGAAGAMFDVVGVAADMEVVGEAGGRKLRGDSVMGERGWSRFCSNEFLRLRVGSLLSRSSSLGQLELEICRREGGCSGGGSPIMPLSRGEGSENSFRRDRDDDPPEWRRAVSTGRGSRTPSRLSRWVLDALDGSRTKSGKCPG